MILACLILLAVVLAVTVLLDQRLVAKGTPRPLTPSGNRRATLQRVLYLGFAAAAVAVFLLAPDTFARTIGSVGILGVAGMFIDAQCVLSDAQAVTVTAVSTNTYDTGAAGNAFDVGEPMCIGFTVDVAAVTTSGDETYQFQVIQSANADLSSQDVLVQTDTALITRALLVAGYRFYLPIPPGLKTKRYVGARYVTGGNADRAISVTAYIQPLAMIQNDKTYASGFLIDS